MKKYLPIILLAAGLLVIGGVFIFVRGRKSKDTPTDEESALLDISLEERPVVSLTPTKDGHYLNLKVEKIVIDAQSLDYELLYDTAESVTQGVPGTIELDGKDGFEEELLLGSESSGKFRYDEGVEKGSITLRFRNGEGKLLVKFTSDFHLQTSTDILSSQDGVFKFNLSDKTSVFFVTMHTVGYPGESPAKVENGPFGVFSSTEKKVSGPVELNSTNVYYWDGGNWKKLEDKSAPDIGIFFGSSE